MPSRRGECPPALVRAARWFPSAALLALAPKCTLCVAAYVGLGTAAGLSGAELCGAAPDSTGGWATWSAWLGVTGILTWTGVLAWRCATRGQPWGDARR